MAPRLDKHMAAVSKLQRLLVGVTDPSVDYVVNQATARVDANTTVDPDFQWLAVPEGTPALQWPLPLLVIEISDTTYKKDSGIKLRKYAMRGYPEYWIIHCSARRLEVYRNPSNPSGQLEDCLYREVRRLGAGDSIGPIARPNVTFRVDDLLP